MQINTEWSGQIHACTSCHKKFTVPKENEEPVASTASYGGQAASYGGQASCWRYIYNCLKNKFNCYDGRASRKEFWSFLAFYLLTFFPIILGLGLFLIYLFCINLILGIIASAAIGYMGYYSCADDVGWLFIALASLFKPIIAVTIRRLHDIGLSGWHILWALMPPFAGIFIILFLALLPSQPHPNKYGDGPDPE